MQNFVSNEIEKRKEKLYDLSDRIWEYAEVLYTEVRSSAALIEVLKEEGFEVKENIDDIKTAFTGSYGSGAPVIGILGEYDALFNMSQVSGVAEKKILKEGEAGHGCGHNLLGVGSLAAAIAVKEYLKNNDVSGTVVYFGCPAEEGGSGKAFMARDGVFDGVDVAITWHPFCLNQVRTRSSAAAIEADFTFHGVSSHASSSPFLGRSALDAVELMSVGTQYMREHIIDTARVHSAILDTGGRSANIIPDRATVRYLCRDLTNQGALDVYNWILEIAEGAAKMTQTKVEVALGSAYSNTINNTVLEDLMEKCLFEFEMEPLTEEETAEMQALYNTFNMDRATEERLSKMYGGASTPILMEHLGEPFFPFPLPNNPNPPINTASTDVGDVSWVCPTVSMSGGTWAAWSPGHAWQTVSQGKSGASHKGMLYAGKTMALTAIRLFEDPEIIREAHEEWKKRVGEKGYICPIPSYVKPGDGRK